MATGVLYALVMRLCAAIECVCKVWTALPAVSHIGTGHKGYNSYTPQHQNGLGKVQLSYLHNKEPTLPMAAISTLAEYLYVKNPKGKNQ